jgi:hypothetical protein
VWRADRALARVAAGDMSAVDLVRTAGGAALTAAAQLAGAPAAESLGRVAGQFARDGEPLPACLPDSATAAQPSLARVLPGLPAATRRRVRALLARLPGSLAAQARRLALAVHAGAVTCAASPAVLQALTYDADGVAAAGPALTTGSPRLRGRPGPPLARVSRELSMVAKLMSPLPLPSCAAAARLRWSISVQRRLWRRLRVSHDRV